ncbi:hypothetical protein J3B02_000084 [Coemansia erecta]|uniref:Cytosol aminopeptidase domain-containing protein n=1 Tax=Coemansia asiatica TaxID=1052880 RepID=A0A9W7XR57_9FUNG|nr:hypothetical protein LPJ64_000872 [Coemansia asiatica]KAJ2858703.1 hypothetical protein J3B02_000084 [Coemansia erecta]KAJ2879514.1 hypothetical protein FB639_003071 [Coemansia asiatica]
MYSSTLSRISRTAGLAVTKSPLVRAIATSRTLLSQAKEGLVLGLFSSNKLCGADQAALAASQQKHILDHVSALGHHAGESGSVHLMLSDDLKKQIAVVGLGSESAKEQQNEVVRMAVANGIKRLCANKVSSVSVGPMPSAKAASEGAALALYSFDQFKTKKAADDKPRRITYMADETQQKQEGADGWHAGEIYAEAQNWARDLTNTPANFMTPTIFAQQVKEQLQSLSNIVVNVYDAQWAEEQRMGGLLAVSRGSEEPLRFVEIIYKGDASSKDVSLAMVGKGVTFDTGGYSLKPGKYMDLMKGDMGGGAAVVSAMRAIAKLQMPINVVATVPLCENMVSGCAIKVSDIYTSRAGLTVEVMNTDAEGRIVLGDALHYTVEKHQPRNIIDVATLTGAMVVALGELYTGVFTPSPKLWSRISAASDASDEPVWRMPLHDVWDSMLKSPVADLSNIGNKSEAGACTGAAFLRYFVRDTTSKEKTVPRDQNNDESLPRWAHLDIAGPMEGTTNAGHHHKGMSGRPTRLLIELANQITKEKL